MKRIEIDISPAGATRLWYPQDHDSEYRCVEIPASNEVAHEVVRFLVMEYQSQGPTKIAATFANPTQSIIDAILAGEKTQGALQLAGDRKRWSDVKSATGVQVRARRYDSRGVPENISLADLGLD